MRTVSVGVVGCGMNSDNHLRVYSSIEGVRLVAVCDTDQAKAEYKAHRYGAEQALTDYHSMLDLDLDLVDIVTPTSTHAELSELALDSGHNVLVEKPMAASSKECRDMIDAARKSGRTLCVVHNKRFFDSIMETKAAIDREGLTVSRMRISQFEPFGYVEGRPGWILTEESGGILLDALVHHIYLIQHFLGHIHSVYATAYRVKQPVNDSITLLVKGGGSVGVCEFEWNVKEPSTTFQLITGQGDCFDGDLSHDFVLRRSRSYRNRRTTALRSLYEDLHEPFIKWTGHLRNFLQMRSYVRALPFHLTFFVLIRQLLSFLAGDRPSPPVTAEEGFQAIRVLEAAKKSIETGNEQSPE